MDLGKAVRGERCGGAVTCEVQDWDVHPGPAFLLSTYSPTEGAAKGAGISVRGSPRAVVVKVGSGTGPVRGYFTQKQTTSSSQPPGPDGVEPMGVLGITWEGLCSQTP